MTSSGSILTVVVLLVAGTVGDLTAITAGLIAAMQRKYSSGCVVLLTSSDFENLTQQEKWIQKQLRKLLSQERIQVMASWIQTLNSTTQYCPDRIPLNVILSNDSQVKTKLEEFSKTQTLVGGTWLLFLPTNNITSFFADIYVPFNCEFLVTWRGKKSMPIYEVYNVARGKSTSQNYYGSWNETTGLVSDKFNIFRRRENLEGIVLKAITAEDPPIMTIDESTRNVSGFLGRVWNILEKKMNFRTNYTITSDMTKGQSLKEGDCSGMIGRLQCREVDVALGAFSTSSYPGVPIKFTMPLIYTTYQVYIKKLKGRTTEWDAFLTPFSSRLWLVLIVTIMFMSVYLATFYNIGRRIGNEEAGGPELYTLYECCLYVFGAFCQQGHDITPKSTPCRIIYITAYLTALVLLAAYSAALISSLTVSHSNLPFTDLDGILKHKRYKMGVVDKSEMFYTFSDEEENGIFGEVYRKLMAPDSENFPLESLGGLQRVCDTDYAFLAIPESVMPLLSKVNCTIIPLPYKTYPISLAIAFTPDNPYREFISYRLRMLRDGGVLQRLRIKNWAPLSETEIKSTLVSVDLSAVAPLLILLTSSVIVSIVVLIAERGKSPLNYKKSSSSVFGRKPRIERKAFPFNKSPRTDFKTKNSYALFPRKLMSHNVTPTSREFHQ